MDKLFLAVVVSGLLVLVTAAGLYALSKGTVTPHPPTHAIRLKTPPEIGKQDRQ
jgi:uncharacterized membrane protein YfbV (UPF0208 family)